MDDDSKNRLLSVRGNMEKLVTAIGRIDGRLESVRYMVAQRVLRTFHYSNDP